MLYIQKNLLRDVLKCAIDIFSGVVAYILTGFGFIFIFVISAVYINSSENFLCLGIIENIILLDGAKKNRVKQFIRFTFLDELLQILNVQPAKCYW